MDLAVKILDGSFFRAGEAAPLTVQRAKFEMHGEFQAKKRGNARKRKKTAQIVEDKALGWGGFDDKIKDTEVRFACHLCCVAFRMVRSNFRPLAALSLLRSSADCTDAVTEHRSDLGEGLTHADCNYQPWLVLPVIHSLWLVQVTVILSHMFSPDELAAEPHLGKELEADITSECARLGPLVKVRPVLSVCWEQCRAGADHVP